MIRSGADVSVQTREVKLAQQREEITRRRHTQIPSFTVIQIFSDVHLVEKFTIPVLV